MASRRLVPPSVREALLGIPSDIASLERNYLLADDDLDLIGTRRRPENRFGLALHIALLRHPGQGWHDDTEPPAPLPAAYQSPGRVDCGSRTEHWGSRPLFDAVVVLEFPLALAVTVDMPFFKAIGGPSRKVSRDLDEGDIIWLVPQISDEYQLEALHWEVLSLEDSSDKLLAAKTVKRGEFEEALRAKLQPLQGRTV